MLNALNGMGYSAQLPPGFTATPIDAIGGYWVLPPGSHPPPFSPSLIWIEPIYPQFFPVLMQNYYNFDNPMVALQNAYSLGLVSVLQVAAMRQTNINGAITHIREFDAMSANGQPMRMTGMLMQGPMSAVQVMIGTNLFQWVQFAGISLQFVASVRLNGTFQSTSEVRSIVDQNRPDQIEMQLVNSDQSVASIMAMPTQVRGQVVYQVHVEAGGTYIAGNVNGSAVQFGDHNISKVSDSIAPSPTQPIQ